MRNGFVSVSVLALGMALGAQAVADEHEIGEELYTRFCAACHGDDGAGTGDMQSFLNIQMPNLRTISARNDGEFPLLQVIHVIDGRTGVRAHGGPMPLWGGVFMNENLESMGIYGSALETRGRVLSLALYLETLQD